MVVPFSSYDSEIYGRAAVLFDSGIRTVRTPPWRSRSVLTRCCSGGPTRTG